jgi:hypothetical protein
VTVRRSTASPGLRLNYGPTIRLDPDGNNVGLVSHNGVE